MTDRRFTVLLLDDENFQRCSLTDDLSRAGFLVTPLADPDDVMREVMERRARYDFAVFDLEFTNPSTTISDGLRLCERVARLDPSLPIILYHDSSMSDPSKTSGRPVPTLAEAVAAGAYRLVVRGGVKQILAGLVEEIEELDTLAHELDRLKEARRQMSHLVLGLGVGFQVVDQWGKVWFTDEEFGRIAGKSGLSPMNCFCQSYGYLLAHGPCHNCITIPLIKSCSPDGKDGTFYSPTYPNGPGTPPVFRYLHVRVTPIQSLVRSFGESDSGKVQKRTIAAIEAVSKVSQSSIEYLSRYEHLEMLACTLQDMGFRRVSVFRFRQQGEDARYGAMKGIVARTGPIGPAGTVDISDVEVPLALEIRGELRDAISTSVVPVDGNLVFDEKSRTALGLVSAHPPVLISIFRPDGSSLGFVLLDNVGKSDTVPLTAMDIASPKTCGVCVPSSPFTVFEEIGRVLLQKPEASVGVAKTGELAAMVECERTFEKVRLRVSSEISGKPEIKIEVTLKAMVEHLTGLGAAHVRRIDGDWAESAAYVGDYGPVAAKRIDIRVSKRFTARVARTGIPVVIGDLEAEYGDRPPGWGEFDDASWCAIRNYRSHAIYPLMSGSRLLGTVSFQARDASFFTPARQHLLKLTCGLLTRALEDWGILDQADVATTLPLRAAMLVAHNLGQPVATIQRYLEALNRDLQEGLPLNVERVAGIERQCRRMADMKTSLNRLLNAKPGEMEPVHIRPILESLVRETVGDQLIDWAVETGLDVVTTRPSILNACLPVLIKNAVEALTDPPAPVQRITIRARALDDGMLEVAVCDTGPGVPLALVPKLFDPMQSGKSGGMGIGLALAAHLVKQDSGQIGYDRRDGETVFVLRLPQRA
jgi:CheY-like chemotaxis protein